jgi:hypothetical protein
MGLCFSCLVIIWACYVLDFGSLSVVHRLDYVN